MKSKNRKSAGGKPLRTKLGLIVALTALVVVAVAPMAAGEWYFKPAYPNYAPSGMPDFNQTQDTWMKGGQWTFCGPVAVANCFWWFDSKYADPTGMPGDGVDIFPLVQSYGTVDDHDPANVDDLATPWPPGNELVERLAWCMDTDGMRTGSPHSGTDVHVMEQCINDWLNATGLNRTFYEHTVKEPEFYYIEDEIKRCQDVILLLGFWEDRGEPTGWVRIGGHYVTCAGVDSENRTIAFSDPFFDNAVATGSGYIVPDPHPPGYSATFHNDAQFVSHDYYFVHSGSISPGGIEYIPEYPVTLLPELCMNFWPMNVPPEFESMQGEWLGGAIHTEIEYAVLISPLVLTPFLINGWVNCTDGDPVNGPIVTITNLNTSEVFIAETNASSNYYQVITSSLNVSAGNVLHFNASNSNSTEFDHTVTEAEMCAGGFEQNATIECGPAGICGDVDGDGDITMGDVGLLWPHVFFPAEYPLVNEWAGDVDGDGDITMGDVGLLWPHVFFPAGVSVELPMNNGRMEYKEMNREEEKSKRGIYSACNPRTVGLFIVALITLCVFTHAASAAQISVEPSFQTVSNGENFTVDIYVDPEGNATAGVDYILHFNNTLLSATSLVSGTFFSGFTTNTYGEGINNSTGMIDYGEAAQGSGGVTTPGTLTTITFQAIADYGTSELCFDEMWTELSDPDGYPITTDISDGSVKLGLCGDVDGDGDITMGDVGLLWPYVFFPAEYPLASEWAGDVDGDGDITMGDVGLLWPYVFFPEQYPLNCK